MFELHTIPPVRPETGVNSLVRVSGRLARSFTPAAVLKTVSFLSQSSFDIVTSKLDEERRLLDRLNNASDLEEYQQCAARLDDLQRHNEWKAQKESAEATYDPITIQTHMQQLAYATDTSDLGSILHLVRTSLSRDLGGMNTLEMYKHSWSGTKYLTDQYIATVLKAIEKLTQSTVDFQLDTEEVRFYLQSLEDSVKYFGRSALTLSGGASFGLKHIGVVKALHEAGLLPEIISGASAGSIAAAIVSVRTDEELADPLDKLQRSELSCFDPPGTTSAGWLKRRLHQYFTQGVFFTTQNLETFMKTWVGEMTFREAHNKTGRTLNICVSSAENEEPRLLNYITAPDVLIWSAVCASCSVPGVFPTANIWEKDQLTKETRLWMKHAKQMFVDGSLDHDIPMRKLSEMFNVNFFIVSQVNPHVRMFIDPEPQFFGVKQERASLGWGISSLLRASKHVLRRQLIEKAQQLTHLGASPSLLRYVSLLSQQYTGDVNILPDISIVEYPSMLSNPTPEAISRAVVEGERATWPKTYRLKNCVAIELALLQATHRLRERVFFGPEAKAAREASRRSRRGRSGSIRGQRPGLVRRRSLSQEFQPTNVFAVGALRVRSPPAPSPQGLRRNRSLSHLQIPVAAPETVMTTPTPTPILSPQAGIDHLIPGGMFGDVRRLHMTAIE